MLNVLQLTIPKNTIHIQKEATGIRKHSLPFSKPLRILLYNVDLCMMQDIN